MLSRALTLAALLTLGGAVAAYAQGHGGGGGMGHGGGMPGGMVGNGGNPWSESRPSPPLEGSETVRSSGSQFGPAGRWWNDDRVVRSVGLKTEQQRRMDDVFAANRETLIKAFKSFQHEQGQLAKLARSRNLDEAAIFQQIDKVNAARSELEKATVHYQIALRKELTDEQNARLDDLRDTPKASDPQQ